MYHYVAENQSWNSILQERFRAAGDNLSLYLQGMLICRQLSASELFFSVRDPNGTSHRRYSKFIQQKSSSQ
jgi:hypothetical protein